MKAAQGTLWPTYRPGDDGQAAGEHRIHIPAPTPIRTAPPMPLKSEIAHHFGYSYVYHFWREVFFDKIMPESRYNYDSIRSVRRIPADLARELYNKYEIYHLRRLHD